jgi:hypothetical protein
MTTHIKSFLLIVFLATTSLAFAQKDPNRTYSSRLTGDVIAAYELEKAPALLDAWFKTTDAAERQLIETELASFSTMNEPTALRARAIGLGTKTFSPDEIRLVHLQRNIQLYKQLGETDNLESAKEALADLRKKLAK